MSDRVVRNEPNWRRAAVIALVCGVALHGAQALGLFARRGLAGFLELFGVFYVVMLGQAAGRLLIAVERRIARPVITRSAAILLAAALLAIPLVILRRDQFEFGIIDGAFHWNAGVDAVTIAGALLALSLIRGTTDGLTWLSRGMLHLRTQITVVALASAIFAAVAALVLRSTVRLEHAAGPIANLLGGAIALLIAIGPVVAFARRVARGLSEPVQRSAEALARVGRGELEVQLEVLGRDELAQMASAFNGMVAGLRDKVFLEQAFGRYASPAVLTALRDAGGLTVAAGRREATVLFADIRGFTSWSEQVAPEEVMRVLNLYFERVVQVVEAQGGYLNKFIGDAVMVIFNAPLEQIDHAARGLACARALQAAVRELNQSHAFGAKELQIGVGLNTGPLVAGTLGGERRAEYTVIGDTVNVASRLTSKAGPGEILVGASTAQAAGAQGLEPIAPLSVKGKAEPLAVFRVATAQAA